MAATQNTMLTNLMAGEDMSDWQYKGVALSSVADKTVVKVAAAGDFGFILQNKPKAGEGAAVCFAGRTLAVANAAYARKDALAFSIDGELEVAEDADDWIIGYALEAAVGAGEVREIFLTYTKQ